MGRATIVPKNVGSLTVRLAGSVSVGVGSGGAVDEFCTMVSYAKDAGPASITIAPPMPLEFWVTVELTTDTGGSSSDWTAIAPPMNRATLWSNVDASIDTDEGSVR